RRSLPLRRLVHGRDLPCLRRHRPPPSEARAHAEDRLAGEHGVGDLGRETRLLHVLAARELGQDGQGQRAVPEGVRLGRETTHDPLRRRLPEGGPRAAAHHALRPGPVLPEPDLRGRGAGARAPMIRAPLAAASLLALEIVGAGTVAAEVAHPERLPRADPAELSYTYEPGAFTPDYEPPAPGSYALPVIDTIEAHPLLDVDGRPTTLFAVKGDRFAIVAFVYTTCVEAAGCPVSLAVLHRLDAELAADPGLTRRVALITVSFDP